MNIKNSVTAWKNWT